MSTDEQKADVVAFDVAAAAAWDFVLPKLIDMNRKKGLAGVWSTGYRSGWTAAERSHQATITALQECIKELEGERDFAHEMLLLADRFKVGEKHGHPVWVISRGPNSWAVWDGAFVLNSDGDWEFEPFPSNRDEDFITRTRWAFSDALLRARSALKDSGNGSEVAR